MRTSHVPQLFDVRRLPTAELLVALAVFSGMLSESD